MRQGASTSWEAWEKFITSGNYTSYTVKKDGTGASGTWGIGISGNAASATKPLGFNIRQTSISWGTLANSSYTCITRWDTANSGSVAFADKDG
jgi:hypothetical protein